MERSGNGKVALVTGSGRQRVGHAIVEALAARGYSIAIHYRTAAEEAQRTVRRLKERGLKACAFQADLALAGDVDRLIEQTLGTFGRLDVLVTSAAIYEPAALEAITADDLHRHFDINALGTFLCCRGAGLAMVAQPEGGAIVTIGDWATVRPYPDYAAYMLSKGAIPTLTRTLAIELARRNPAVRVNCILPGPVMFPSDMPEAERARAIAATLVKRPGKPEHVAHAVLFLVENDFVTGVCLPVDGGRTIAR
jgi:pteridine reductase